MATKEQIQIAKGLMQSGLTPQEAAMRVKENSVTNKAGATSVLTANEMQLRQKNLGTQQPTTPTVQAPETPVIPQNLSTQPEVVKSVVQTHTTPVAPPTPSPTAQIQPVVTPQVTTPKVPVKKKEPVVSTVFNPKTVLSQ